MSDNPERPPLPDRLSVDPRSPHHVAAVFEHAIGIRLNDKERFDVEEYCISEGWVRVPGRQDARPQGPAAADQAEGQGRGVLPLTVRSGHRQAACSSRYAITSRCNAASSPR